MTVLARGPAGAVTANAEAQDGEALGALAAALACDGRPRAELPRHRAPRPQQGRGVLVISMGEFLLVQETSSLKLSRKKESSSWAPFPLLSWSLCPWGKAVVCGQCHGSEVAEPQGPRCQRVPPRVPSLRLRQLRVGEVMRARMRTWKSGWRSFPGEAGAES